MEGLGSRGEYQKSLTLYGRLKRFAWLTAPKAAWRFLFSGFSKRDLFTRSANT